MKRPTLKRRLVLSPALLDKARAVRSAAVRVGGDTPMCVLELAKLDLADELLAALERQQDDDTAQTRQASR